MNFHKSKYFFKNHRELGSMVFLCYDSRLNRSEKNEKLDLSTYGRHSSKLLWNSLNYYKSRNEKWFHGRRSSD